MKTAAFFAPALACGVERWQVKTLSDPDADEALNADATEVTIRDLVMSGGRFAAGNERAPEERRQVVVEGWLEEWRQEADADIHVVLTDGKWATIVAEFPHPDCVGNPDARDAIDGARGQLIEIIQAHRGRAHIPVRVRGVVFFDRDHGQRGGAPGGIELHPVLEISGTD